MTQNIATVNIVDQIWDDIETTVTGLTLVKQAKVKQYDAETFFNNAKNMKLPAVGIIYEGSTPTNPGGTAGASLSVDVTFGIYVIATLHTGDKNLASSTQISKAILDAMKIRKSPARHEYRFGGEYPFDVGIGIGYVQRWLTKAQFTN